MLNSFKNKFKTFLNSEKDVPIIAGFVSGFYPFIYYYSENFYGKNSIEHLAFFSLLFIALPILVFVITYFLFNRIEFLNPYKKHALFVLIILTVSAGLSQVIHLTLRKKLLVLIMMISAAVSIKLYKEYKKLLVLIFIMSVLPLGNTLINLYDSLKPMKWLEQPDDIENVILKKKPNIYLIQPDGYVSKEVMEKQPYKYNSDLYNWLENDGFKLYPNFRSNYPATLLSNAAMFGMKQNYFGDVVFPTIEMLNSRKLLSGANPVISILKNNNYTNYLIAQDEYFQMNYCEQKYDYTNISLDEIPFFSHGGNVPKVLFNDIKKAVDSKDTNPKFLFIEKLLPHHIMLKDKKGELEKEREWYLNRVEEVNIWLKETINYIEDNDNNSIIILLADHGGMVGLENYSEKYANSKPVHLNSIFSTLAAIKWNGYLLNDFDTELKTNVNLFRVLFSVLSENKDYLNHLEDNSSYNLNYENRFYNSVYKAIDDNGNILLKSNSNK